MNVEEPQLELNSIVSRHFITRFDHECHTSVTTRDDSFDILLASSSGEDALQALKTPLSSTVHH